jgi:hypothetical protein
MCWHKWPKKWVDHLRYKATDSVAQQMKRCQKCNKIKIRDV